MNNEKLTPENEAFAKELKWNYSMGISLDNGAERVYTCEHRGMKLQANLWTPKNRKSGKWGTGTMTYSFTNEKEVFKSRNKFIDEIRKRTLTITP